MTTSRNNTIMSWMAYTDFLSRLRIAAGILLPLNTRTLLLYPGGRDCIGTAGVDAYGLSAATLWLPLMKVGNLLENRLFNKIEGTLYIKELARVTPQIQVLEDLLKDSSSAT